MKFIKFSTLLFIIIGFGQNVFGQNWDRVVNLRGSWKFSIGDDLDWSKPVYDDRNWESIKVPAMWEDQGYNGYDGYAWYRKHFKISSSANGNYFTLNLGRIDDVDQVYVNGNLIGGSGVFPPHYKSAYSAWRMYYLHKNIFNYGGDNVIAVRVYDSQLGGGIVEGDPGIYKKENTLSLDIDLDGLWKFKTGDNLSWKDPKLDDQKWGNVFVPGFWETQGYCDYNGFAWYRKSFYANDEMAKKRLVLVMGRIDDIDEVYLNGKLIGSTGNMNDEPISFNDHGEYEKFRGYYIPDGLIEPNKENIIAVRVYDGYNVGGIYDGPVGVITQDRYAKFWKEQKRYSGKNNFWKWLFD
jgi:hypothetical protein